jgi:spore maturation protein CgeB
VYLATRDRYYSQARELFSTPGYEARSRELLLRSWSGPAQIKSRASDVRLFLSTMMIETACPILPELQRNFDATVFDYSPYVPAMHSAGSNGSWRDRLQEDLLAAVRKAHAERPLDLVWLYVTHRECKPQTLQAIRAMGIPVAVISLDDKHAFEQDLSVGLPNGQKPLIGSADVFLTNSAECLRWYIAVGGAAYFFPEAADPDFFRPIPVQKDIPVSFVGGAYGPRVKFIERLKKAGIPIHCFGRGWGTRVVSQPEMVEIFNRSLLNLGYGGVGMSEQITCLKGRDFEVPMTGNLYLTTYDAELTRMYDIGREIACYRSEWDCVEQIRYYLERPEEARLMGYAARERSIQQHTWTRRMTALLTWMGILAQEG